MLGNGCCEHFSMYTIWNCYVAHAKLKWYMHIIPQLKKEKLKKNYFAILSLKSCTFKGHSSAHKVVPTQRCANKK